MVVLWHWLWHVPLVMPLVVRYGGRGSEGKVQHGTGVQEQGPQARYVGRYAMFWIYVPMFARAAWQYVIACRCVTA
jgi:hypothetical protein